MAAPSENDKQRHVRRRAARPLDTPYWRFHVPDKETRWKHFLIVGCIVVVFAVVFGIVKAVNDSNWATETNKRVSARYRLDDLYVSTDDRNLIGISFEDKKIVLGSGLQDSAWDFSQLTAVEVIENGATVTQTNRGSQLVGAMVGGLAFGGAGAVVGGLSGKSHSRARTRNISLKVTIDDRVKPAWTISFLKWRSEKGLEPDGFIAKQARMNVERIHAHLLNAMRHTRTPEISPAPILNADELKKLWDLKQAGILTEAEFDVQKQRLLGSSDSVAVVTATETKSTPGLGTVYK
jgi:hypothetical protein